MPYMRKRILSGSVLEIAEYYTLRTPRGIGRLELGEHPLRGKNHKITTSQQQKINNRNAVLRLGRLINANFGPFDLFITTDYAVEPVLPNGESDESQALKDQQKFIRRLREKYRRAGGENFRYIAVIEKATEKSRKRIHHHIFLPKMSMDAAVSCWDLGGLNIRRLDAAKDYRALANYLSKDPTLGSEHRKRWTQSKNLKKPVVKVRRIIYPGDYIEPPQGYKQIIDRSYWSDITGMSRYIRYVKMDGTDMAGQVLHGTRTGPDPIPWEDERKSVWST